MLIFKIKKKSLVCVYIFVSIVIHVRHVIQSIAEEMRNISIVRDLCLRKHSGVLVEQASSGNAIIIPAFKSSCSLIEIGGKPQLSEPIWDINHAK